MRTWPCKTRGEVVKSTKGTWVHTPFFLSLITAAFSSSCCSVDHPGWMGIPQASPQLVRVVGELGRGSPNSWTAKDRCRPRNERLIRALTDKLLSDFGWSSLELPQLPQSHSSSGHLSQANCWSSGAVVPRHSALFQSNGNRKTCVVRMYLFPFECHLLSADLALFHVFKNFPFVGKQRLVTGLYHCWCLMQKLRTKLVFS